METEKNQTQVRAEIGWLWERETEDVRQTDSGQVLFKEYKVDVKHNRIESVWHKTGWSLAAGESTTIELDYLTRKTVGGTLDVGFLDVRAVLVVNNGPGKLVVTPGESSGWEGPWESSVSPKNIVPPEGAILLSAGAAPWKVTIISNNLTFTAKSDKCLFDIAIVGKTDDLPSSESSGSSSSSGSTSSSSSSSSSESISE